MKKLSLLFLGIMCLIFFSISSCRKKEDAGDGFEIATKPKHCYNGEKDEDETTADCGGSCGSCSSGVVESSCGMTLNTVVASGTGGGTYSVTSCTKAVSGSKLIFTVGTSNGGTIIITTNANVVAEYDLEPGGSSPSIYEYTARVEGLQPYTGNYDMDDSFSGTNMILFDGSNYYIDFCGLQFLYGGSFGYTIGIDVYAKVN